MSGTMPAVLLYSLLLGVGLGAVFTVFEVLRIVLALGKAMTFLLDAFFCVLAAAASFLLALAATGGVLRFYQAGCEILGFACVYLTVTYAVRCLLQRLMRRAENWAGKLRGQRKRAGEKIWKKKPRHTREEGEKYNFFGIRLKKSKKNT